MPKTLQGGREKERERERERGRERELGETLRDTCTLYAYLEFS